MKKRGLNRHSDGMLPGRAASGVYSRRRIYSPFLPRKKDRERYALPARHCINSIYLLNDRDVDSLRTSVALSSVEGDLLAILKGLVALCVDSGEVNEDLALVSIIRDKSVALRRVEPLNSTVMHLNASQKKIYKIGLYSHKPKITYFSKPWIKTRMI